MSEQISGDSGQVAAQGSVRTRLLDCLAKATKAEKLLANYMIGELSDLPFQTAAEVAKKVGVSELTVGRFCRSLGYERFKDLIAELRHDIGRQPWMIGDRLREFQKRSREGGDISARSLELAIASLVKIYEMPNTAEWSTAMKRLAIAKRVYVTGFQTERGMALYFGHQLQYLRDGVHVLDLAGGNFTEMLLTETSDSTLVIFEARRYSRQALLLAAKARDAGIPVTLVTDVYCDWGRDVANEIFAVQTDANLFFESTAAMASLVNLMINAVFTEIGPAVESRLEAVSKLYGEFTGHVSAISENSAANTLKSNAARK